jgi:hypothetical protein
MNSCQFSDDLTSSEHIRCLEGSTSVATAFCQIFVSDQSHAIRLWLPKIILAHTFHITSDQNCVRLWLHGIKCCNNYNEIAGAKTTINYIFRRLRRSIPTVETSFDSRFDCSVAVVHRRLKNYFFLPSRLSLLAKLWVHDTRMESLL